MHPVHRAVPYGLHRMRSARMRFVERELPLDPAMPTMSGQRSWLRKMLLAVGLILAVLLAGCADGRSVRAEVDHAIAATSGADSFRAVQTVNVRTQYGIIEARLEYHYRAPDAARLAADPASPFEEVVLIGSEAWVRVDQDWTPADAEAMRVLVFAPLTAIVQLEDAAGLSDVGPGPDVAGESTRLYRLTLPEYGSNVAEIILLQADSVPGIADDLATIAEGFEDIEAVVDVTVGVDTEFIYLAEITFEGVAFAGVVTIEIDEYNQPVTIDPPI